MYTFNTLNDRDLEELSLDLLNKELGLSFQSFKNGRDKGIDLRHSNPKDENNIIVQVKHYLNSGYSQFKYSLKTNELTKVKLLNPKRYIIVTSIGLTPQNKEEIKEIFSPYIHSTSDIIGQNDLNILLRKYKEVETTHFKLWLSSSNVLQRILKNGVNLRSDFTESKIKKKVQLFVENKAHSKAVKLLNTHNFILITGAPGIGKTMLANILTFQLLEKGYELVYVYNIKEAEEKFSRDKKQVFYFDDFLGANYYELSVARNNDSAIVHFVERIQGSKDKKLILTSRTVVLNMAAENSEKILNSNIDTSKHEVKIEDYTKYDRAKILYNHLFFSDLNENLKDAFFTEGFHWFVINHKSYNPRIIEFFTDSQRYEKSISQEDYKISVRNKLDKPEDIWKKSFENQLTDTSQIYLTTLFSINDSNEDTIKECFELRIKHEVKKNGLRKKSDLYLKTINELLGGFINRTITDLIWAKYTSVSFFNPSIIDFLLSYLSLTNKDEKWEIFSSALYFEQFTYRFQTKRNKRNILKNKITIHSKDIKKLKKIYIKKYPKLRPRNGDANINISGMINSLDLFDFKEIKDFFENNLSDFSFENEIIKNNDIPNLIKLLDYIEEYKIIDDNHDFIKICFLNIIKVVDDPSDYEIIKDFFEYSDEYKILIKKFIDLDEDYKFFIDERMSTFWDRNYESYLLEIPQINEITDFDELNSYVNERIYEGKYLARVLGVDESYMLATDSINLEEIVENNKLNELGDEENPSIKEILNSSLSDNETSLINDLFQKISE
ncbi:restriction endonuclease [Maribacter sp. Asnod1-A12]|uniref:nSTAND3 domain-containing NTPase n=1 Tax=Maribacter sp. Asnod1-A12 TaxID=3160576 RepID=UPI0038700722